jgi:hypothetical protein
VKPTYSAFINAKIRLCGFRSPSSGAGKLSRIDGIDLLYRMRGITRLEKAGQIAWTWNHLRNFARDRHAHSLGGFTLRVFDGVTYAGFDSHPAPPTPSVSYQKAAKPVYLAFAAAETFPSHKHRKPPKPTCSLIFCHHKAENWPSTHYGPNCLWSKGPGAGAAAGGRACGPVCTAHARWT